MSTTSNQTHPWQETYWPIHLAAFLYMMLIGGFSVAAWIDNGEPFRAAMCAGAQVLAVVCAILARRAFTADMKLSGSVSIVFAGGCAYWAAQGLRHAWESNGATIDTAAVVFLAALEPGLFLLAEHIEQTRRDKKAVADRELCEEAETLKRIRDRQDAEERKRLGLDNPVATFPQSRRPSVARVAATGGATLMAGTSPAHAMVPHQDVTPAAIHRAATEPEATVRDISFDVASRFGDRMHDAGDRVSYRELALSISAATGIDATKVKARLERLFKAANIKIGERWPPPAKPLAA